MELSKRFHVLLGIAGACSLLLSAGCEPVAAVRPARSPAEIDPFRDRPLRTGKPRVLVLMPASSQTLEVWSSLSQELGADFDVVTRRIQAETTTRAIGDAIASVKPACLVLMDNTTLRLYSRYQHQQPRDFHHPPAIVALTSFLAEQSAAIENAIGIAYEVPAVTQFSRLRTLIKRPIRRVGVVFRPALEPFVRRQAMLAKAEHLEIVGRQVVAAPQTDDIRDALTSLVERSKVDALWVLNDNALLSPELVASAWLPALSADQRLPVVVGVGALVRMSPPLGTLAMIPDHESLGAQIASLVFELSEQGFQALEWRVDEPVSIETIINGPQARSYFGFSDAQRTSVDEVVETSEE